MRHKPAANLFGQVVFCAGGNIAIVQIKRDQKYSSLSNLFATGPSKTIKNNIINKTKNAFIATMLNPVTKEFT